MAPRLHGQDARSGKAFSLAASPGVQQSRLSGRLVGGDRVLAVMGVKVLDVLGHVVIKPCHSPAAGGRVPCRFNLAVLAVPGGHRAGEIAADFLLVHGIEVMANCVTFRGRAVFSRCRQKG
ncbi:hypothetical protein [Moorella stamsii]|uniref:hypothetical protein n=1 Tax=Neomoorella stamsii TaxID=1266720 RepID=UPI00101AD075|nr:MULTISPECIES: hypothetical protein [Moorella]